MPPVITNIGLNVKFLRRLKGLSQTEFASKVGLTRNNIASYESGMVEPNTANFLKMAQFFQVNPQDMLVTVFADNPVDVVQILPTAPSMLENYLSDHVEEFTKQTNNISRIVEGYKEFYNMRKDNEMSIQEKELFNSMDNLLDLLDTLVKTNSKLIQSVLPDTDI